MNEDIKEYLFQAESLMSVDKYEEALKYLSKAEEIDNMEAEIYKLKGIVYANLDNYDSARKEFNKILKIKRNDGTTLFHLGILEVLEGNLKKGIEYYNNAIANGFRDVQVYYNLGLAYEEMKENDLAIRNYSRGLRIEPNRFDIRYNLLRLLILNKSFEEALKISDGLIQVNPDVFEGYHYKFMLLLELEKNDEAKKVIDDALEMFPNDVGLALDKVSYMMKMEQYEEALAYLNNIENDFDLNEVEQHELLVKKARIYIAHEDVDNSIQELEQAKECYMKQNVIDTEATSFLMYCYIHKMEYEKAMIEVNNLQHVEDENSYVISSWYLKGFIFKMMGKEEEANKSFEEAIAYYRSKSLKNPSIADYYIFRALALKESGKLEKALELVDYLIEVNHDIAEIHILRAKILFQQGKDNEAKEEYDIAINLDKKYNNFIFEDIFAVK